jgi:putative DNA methylase
MTQDRPRLIEVAFPLKQASIDSVHEKNVRHGHISTLHIWPARRPLAACRAALIATLLPDPGNKEERDEIYRRMAGRVVEKVKIKKQSGKVIEEIKEETEGGILHWGRESGEDLEWFRQKIREAYGGRAPKVLDPFAGGGAIPLEAMRLGCEATAIDINPVAWFILKCTLEYPQKLAGQKQPLPEFVLKDKDFMESFFKAQGYKGASLKQQLEKLGLTDDTEDQQIDLLTAEAAKLEADLAWHVRAWGWWVLQQAKAELEPFYPVVDGKPTVAYLWARTVKCKNCRATIPLLRTRWLCKKDSQRTVLTMKPNSERTGVDFQLDFNVPKKGSGAVLRANDKKLGAGTMSKSGAKCPCCDAITTMDDIRLEGKAQRLGSVMTAVAVDRGNGKEFRLPTEEELKALLDVESKLKIVFSEIPYGLPEEETPGPAGAKQNSSSLRIYGLFKWKDIYTSRQLLTLATLIKCTRSAREKIENQIYEGTWTEAIQAYLALAIDRVANRSSCVCIWNMQTSLIEQTFARFALPVLWDFAESNPIEGASGNYAGEIDWVSRVCEHVLEKVSGDYKPKVLNQSSQTINLQDIDVVVTDPPYYDAISYADLMDFFYIWLRRTLLGVSPEMDQAFREPLTPKWNHEKNDGELIDNPNRFNGDNEKSKSVYEEGMFHAFQSCYQVLKPEGRLVIVFAHKHPNAWETLVSAIIRAGFVVDGSWPIQTERTGRIRANSSAALSSSVWLVCRKRPVTARPGWDNRVLDEMREKIRECLREFWDAGIRGPDFVWAATGPAMEAYSKYPAVKKANEPGQLMDVSEFLSHVRRLVLEFVVGRVLSLEGKTEEVSNLDDVTTYYLLHRHDFGMEEAQIGACILYAISCGLSDTALADQFDILVRTKGKSADADDDDDEDMAEDSAADIEEGSGSKVKLKTWMQRKRKNMGYEAPGGRAIPLIDQIHRLMHLWKAGDVVKVDEYLGDRTLRNNALFQQVLQSLIELSSAGSDERALLESISNHIGVRGKDTGYRQTA